MDEFRRSFGLVVAKGIADVLSIVRFTAVGRDQLVLGRRH
jgi:hypothetical protein